jgi:hypothetical protein
VAVSFFWFVVAASNPQLDSSICWWDAQAQDVKAILRIEFNSDKNAMATHLGGSESPVTEESALEALGRPT